MRKSNIFIISLLFLMLILPITSAAEFDFDTECYQGCIKGIANPDNNVMLKVTIKNNFDFWVKVGSENSDSINLRILVENKNLGNWNGNGKETETHKIMGSPAYIPPKSKFEFYIPLNSYNNMERDKRVSDWVLTPTLDLQNIEYYQNPYDEKKAININSQYKIPNSIVDNQVKFEGKSEGVEIQTNSFSKIISVIKGFFSNWTGWIIASVIVGVIIWALTGRGRSRRR